MHIVYIHGNRATPNCFNFIRSQLSRQHEIVLEYDSEQGFYNNHERMLQQLQGIDEIFFIAHSLGGIHALHLANALADKTRGGVTVSTPYGGSEAAVLARLVLPFTQVLKDIHPLSAPVLQSKEFKIERPWTNVVSIHGGSPFMAKPNDGVVTRDSMRDRSDIDLVDVESNHYEVLQSPETVKIIKDMLAALDAEPAQTVPYGSLDGRRFAS
ncbi:lipase family protein [Noviherbaspirillum galbum]|uniref:Alpha/beta hydrolase n=1 Tax=Noviherbaspirillum galbum TaxID=2709383 RepID=A0A6B3SYI7_9BURK|nr:hypothetical protein [Noviherbaspirillum galbum]NEX64865.1 hypothetical protein [Noviherbaspirillum galbum]